MPSVRYHEAVMPSWNIHTAHAERILARCNPLDLGIEDANAFLFGNYVPDIYVGFMVPDATLHIDYCLTHLASLETIPVPDADLFWDNYISRRVAKTPAGRSLTLGAWAHLVADQVYNGRFRAFCYERDLAADEELRKRKQGDFDSFGHSLRISAHVEVTPELKDAAKRFWAYTILPDDVERTARSANAIVDAGAVQSTYDHRPLLGRDWLTETFDACDERIVTWLKAWQGLAGATSRVSAADVRSALAS